MSKSRMRLASTVAMAMIIALGACSGDFSSKKDDGALSEKAGPERQRPTESVFGDDGLTFSSSGSTGVLPEFLTGTPTEGGDSALPVNKYLWQASLDTLSFLPLNSTDPFTGVIATDWGSTQDAPGERFKLTAYILNPNLAASSLKVAVFREVRSEEGLWVPSAVDPDTALKIENAILTRARQIRIASIEQEKTG
ncbi:MAG: DUF3576 domain-containing protein [Pseudomonadota bacterium]